MKASAFAYARATSVAHALELLATHGERAKVLSGGQSLMPAMNLRLISPELIVDIGELAELRGIVVKQGVLTIGALTRHVDLLKSAEVIARMPHCWRMRSPMSRIPRSVTVAQSGVALLTRIRLPNCRPAWSRLAQPSSLAARGARGGLPRTHSSPVSMRQRFRRRSCWSPSSYRRRRQIRRIFFMSSPAGMAITRLSAWQRRRSSRASSSPIIRLGFFAVGDRPLLAESASKLIDVAITPAVLSEASSAAG